MTEEYGHISDAFDMLPEEELLMTKSKTLTEIITHWWGDAEIQDKDPIITDLVDLIEEWLPKEHDTNSYKWNQCIRTIKSNLR